MYNTFYQRHIAPCIYNGEHYLDPTAGQVLLKIEKEELERKRKEKTLIYKKAYDHKKPHKPNNNADKENN